MDLLSFGASKKVTPYIKQWSDPGFWSSFKEWAISRPDTVYYMWFVSLVCLFHTWRKP